MILEALHYVQSDMMGKRIGITANIEHHQLNNVVLKRMPKAPIEHNSLVQYPLKDL
jgi:hypothetical protein